MLQVRGVDGPVLTTRVPGPEDPEGGDGGAPVRGGDGSEGGEESGMEDVFVYGETGEGEEGEEGDAEELEHGGVELSWVELGSLGVWCLGGFVSE